MADVMKIREVSLKYGITARTLRYYENAGLISSTRDDESQYRLYDEKALTRLQQILILRKLNISVRDIKNAFDSNTIDAVMKLLDHKISDIDEEVAILQELKAVVLEFLQQIKSYNFNNQADIRMLYEKSQEIEQLINVDYNGKTATVRKMLEVSERLEKMPDIRIIELPRVRAVCSGDRDLGQFNEWWSGIQIPPEQNLMPRDFMWYKPEIDRSEWIFIPPADICADGFEWIDFPGGLYASASSKEGDDAIRTFQMMHKWIDASELYARSSKENDSVIRYDMFHVITPKRVQALTGYWQWVLYTPIVLKDNLPDEKKHRVG